MTCLPLLWNRRSPRCAGADVLFATHKSHLDKESPNFLCLRQGGLAGLPAKRNKFVFWGLRRPYLPKCGLGWKTRNGLEAQETAKQLSMVPPPHILVNAASAVSVAGTAQAQAMQQAQQARWARRA